jgi:signal peptidase
LDVTLDTANALKCELAAEVLRSSGKLRMQVMGWSMLPAVWPEDVLVVDSIERDQVSEGDIVLFGRNGRLFAHRVVCKTDHSSDPRIVTQGDGMPRPDQPLENAELLGRVSLILRAGKLIDPYKKQGIGQSAMAKLVRHSTGAARILIHLHQLRQTPQEP